MSTDSTRAARENIRHAARLVAEAMELLDDEADRLAVSKLHDQAHRLTLAVEELDRTKHTLSSALGYTA